MTRPCIKCGALPDPAPSRYNRGDYRCNACHAAYLRAGGYNKNRPPQSGSRMPRSYHRAYEAKYYARPEIKAKRAAQMRAYTKDPTLRPKHAARWKANRAVAAGLLTHRDCQSCGNPESEKHHPDYARPLDVVWLCRTCHAKATSHA